MNSITKEVYQSLYSKYQSHMLSLPLAAVEMGMAVQTAYNLSSQNDFPLPVIRLGKRKPLIRIIDLAAFLSGSEVVNQPKRRGRPSKASQLERRNYERDK